MAEAVLEVPDPDLLAEMAAADLAHLPPSERPVVSVAADALRSWLEAAAAFEAADDARPDDLESPQRDPRSHTSRGHAADANRAHAAKRATLASALTDADLDEWSAALSDAIASGAAEPKATPAPSKGGARSAPSAGPEAGAGTGTTASGLRGCVAALDEPLPVPSTAVAPTATHWTAQAAAAHGRGEYAEAARHWDAALEQCSGIASLEPGVALLHGNRAASLLAGHRPSAALAACSRALTVGPRDWVVVARAARCHLLLGAWEQAQALLLSIPPEECRYAGLDHDLRACDGYAQYSAHMKASRPAAALPHITRTVELCPGAVELELLRLEVLEYISVEEAAAEAAAVVAGTKQPPPQLHLLSGLLAFRGDHTGGSIPRALACLARATEHADKETDPGGRSAAVRQATHATAVLKALEQTLRLGREAAQQRQWDKAVRHCNKAMQTDFFGHRRLRAFIHIARAVALTALGHFTEAVADCGDAMLCTDYPDMAAAYAARSDAFAGAGEWPAAAKDAAAAHRMHPTPASSERLARCERWRERTAGSGSGPSSGAAGGGGGGPQSRQSRAAGGGDGARQRAASAPARPAGPTHYETLQVRPDATPAQVTRAYRTAALKWHPDKWAAAADHERQAAEARFKAISNAHGVLADPAQRSRYNTTVGL